MAETAVPTTPAEMEALRVEIERLNRELDQASSENIQSAKYGLGLLEEKQALQFKCEELETLYENARHELEITQEVFTFIRFNLTPLNSSKTLCDIGTTHASLDKILSTLTQSVRISRVAAVVLTMAMAMTMMESALRCANEFRTNHEL